MDFTRVCYENGDNIQTSIIFNKSDHSPVYCVFSPLHLKLDVSEQVKHEPKPSWKRASAEEKESYIACLEEQLAFISVPTPVLECKNVKCRNQDHCDMVDQLTINVLDTVQTVAEQTLPCPSGSKTDRKFDPVPGWKETVKPFRDNAYFWYQVWISCGKPVKTQVHYIMKRTRNIYHYQVNKCKKAEEKIRKNKLLDACLSNGGGDLFNNKV